MTATETIENLFNKPIGTKEQFEAVAQAQFLIDNAIKLVLVLGSTVLVFLPSASVGVTAIAGSLIGAGIVREGWLGQRIHNLENERRARIQVT